MAGAGLLALLDDIAALTDNVAMMIDDVATMAATGTKRTAGIIGDDIAVNAKQVVGVKADRETYVVWQIFKGSLINKLIIVPLFFILSLIADGVLIVPLLVCGGLYLCYEGAEKILHKIKHAKEPTAHQKASIEAAQKDPELSEQKKIKMAVRTDFILSAEIIAITLGAVSEYSEKIAQHYSEFGILATKFAALSCVGLIVTVGVYALVACFVRLDDLGLWLARKKSQISQSLGLFIVKSFAPGFSKFLSFAGTAAMLAVGGDILIHAFIHHTHSLEIILYELKKIPLLVSVIIPMITGFIIGLFLIFISPTLKSALKKIEILIPENIRKHIEP